MVDSQPTIYDVAQRAGVSTATVTVTAAISSGGASCPGIGSLAATLQCDAP